MGHFVKRNRQRLETCGAMITVIVNTMLKKNIMGFWYFLDCLRMYEKQNKNIGSMGLAF